MGLETLPILSEHESGVSLSTQPAGYSPTPEERKTIAMVERKFQKAKTHRKKFDPNWGEYYRYFRGKQWKELRPTYRHSEVVNFIFQTIQSQVPILNDARQRVEFVAQEPSDTEFAKILDDVCESDWTSQNWTYKLAEQLYDGHIIGTGIGGLAYDKEAKLGEGQITFDTEDPFYCFPDPDAENINLKSNYFIVAKPIDVQKLKKEYPDKKDYIKSDLSDLIQDDKRDLEPNRFKSPLDNSVVVEGGSADRLRDHDQVLKITCYCFDDEETEEKEESINKETNLPEVSYIQKLKYPLGRKLCIASGILLEDSPMELEEKLIPYFRWANYIDPRSFWGISEVEQLKGPQNIHNKIYSFALDCLTLMGNPIWVIDNDSDIDDDQLFNRPGLVLRKQKGTEVRREEGTQLQPYVLNLLDRVKEYIDSVSGSQEVSRGVRPEGITAASAIQSLQEAAQTRIRQKARNLDATLQEFGQIYVAYVLKYYTGARVFRVTNNEGVTKYFKFHIETDEEGNKRAKVRPYNQDPETGEYKESIEEREYAIRGEFDVKVTTGSSLPFAKDQKFAKARQMFQDGVIDEEEYLKQAEYPNWQVVLKRVQEKRAQAAAQSQAPPSPA